METERLAASTEPGRWNRVAIVVRLAIIEIMVSADVDILALEAGCADDIGQDQNQARLHESRGFIRELFDGDETQEVSLQVLGLLLEGDIKAEDMLADHLRVLQSRVRVLLVGTD